MPSFRNSAAGSEALAGAGLRSVSWPVDPRRIPQLLHALDPLAALEDPAGESLYGVGESVVLTEAAPFALVDAGQALLAAIAVQGEPPRLLGGFAFDPLRTGKEEWSGFPAGRLVLPELLLSSRGYAVATFPRDDPSALPRLQALLDDAAPVPAPLARCAQSRPARSEEAWRSAVETALRFIGEGALQKLVLARPLHLALDRPLRAAPLLARFAEVHPGCIRFAFRAGSTLFAGATPELLYRRRGDALETMALAGTAKRDPDPQRDGALGTQLLADPKERHEHALVVEALREGLAPLSSALEVEPPGLRRLANVQHLQTLLRARLLPGVTDRALLERLHPTPAVCGLPRAAARALLRELEGFERGWYAGPVGAVSLDGATFAVALRCLLAEGTAARLFVGAGIVGGSDAAREWRETQSKSLAVLRALGHEGAA